VLPYHAFLDGRTAVAAGAVERVAALVSEPAVLKVILETGALPADRIAEATRLAIDHGADFVKTSTGKIGVGATLDAVDAMLAVIAAADRPIGIKPSGGIGTLAAAETYLEHAEAVMGRGWPTPATFRFGASGLLDALLADIAAAAD
jgi:deoxyribose-phosphate aldolase